MPPERGRSVPFRCAAECAPPRRPARPQPLFQQFVCHPAVVGVARTILDSHVRIAQSAQRNIASDEQAPSGE